MINSLCVLQEFDQLQSELSSYEPCFVSGRIFNDQSVGCNVLVQLHTDIIGACNDLQGEGCSSMQSYMKND